MAVRCCRPKTHTKPIVELFAFFIFITELFSFTISEPKRVSEPKPVSGSESQPKSVTESEPKSKLISFVKPIAKPE